MTEPKRVGPYDPLPGFYVASRTRHAGIWKERRDVCGEPIVSTWIDEAGEGETEDMTDLWFRCVSEASRAVATIVFAEEGDHPLKGGLVEVGAALANGRPVYVVGAHHVEASWLRHPLVARHGTLDSAFNAANAILEAFGPKDTT